MVRELSLWEKIGAALIYAQVPPRRWITAITYLLGLSPRKTFYQKALAESTNNFVSGRVSVAQLRNRVHYVSVATVLKNSESRAQGIPGYNTPYIGEGFTARWVAEAPNRTPKDPVIIHFHGGGFVLPWGEGQAVLLISLYKYLKNPRLSILALDRTLVPEATYPTQIKEAAALYYQLTEVDNAENVILGGDASGGNLVSAILSHRVYKHPEAKALVKAVKPIACYSLSCWFDMSVTETGSFITNKHTDKITWHTLHGFAVALCPNEADRRTYWASPSLAPPSYWEGLIPDDYLVVWGGAEVLQDDNLKYVKNTGIKQAYEEPNGTHDGILIELLAFPESQHGELFVFSKLVNFLKGVL